MASKDSQSSIVVKSALVPIVGNNTTEGTGLTVDTLGYESVTFGIYIGVSGDTLSGSVYITPSLEDSPDNSTWTAVAAGNLINSGLAVVDDAAEDAVMQEVGYKGEKRYVRCLLTFTGTHTNGCPIAAVAVLGHARHMPV